MPLSQDRHVGAAVPVAALSVVAASHVLQRGGVAVVDSFTRHIGLAGLG